MKTRILISAFALLPFCAFPGTVQLIPGWAQYANPRLVNCGVRFPDHLYPYFYYTCDGYSGAITSIMNPVGAYVPAHRGSYCEIKYKFSLMTTYTDKFPLMRITGNVSGFDYTDHADYEAGFVHNSYKRKSPVGRRTCEEIVPLLSSQLGILGITEAFSTYYFQGEDHLPSPRLRGTSTSVCLKELDESGLVVDSTCGSSLLLSSSPPPSPVSCVVDSSNILTLDHGLVALSGEPSTVTGEGSVICSGAANVDIGVVNLNNDRKLPLSTTSGNSMDSTIRVDVDGEEMTSARHVYIAKENQPLSFSLSSTVSDFSQSGEYSGSFVLTIFFY